MKTFGQLLGIALGHDGLLLKALAVDLAHGGVLSDPFVHERLGEAGLVALIVAMAAVAPHVDDHVLLEALAELDGEAATPGPRPPGRRR